MLTEKQLTANRANAQLSTGPSTGEGKRKSSLNARRHGLTGQVTAMPEADRLAHDAFAEELIKSLAPEGALELQLAQVIATDSWRINRIAAIEDNIFAVGLEDEPGDPDADHPEVHAALTAARTFTREAKSIALLTLYEQRIHRSFQKNLALLQQLQATRKAACAAEMERAAKLLQFNEMRGLRYEPAKDGFVFSNDQIHAVIDRERRLEQARRIDFNNRKQRKHHALAA